MNDIQKAIKIVKDGGIIIFPTDTAFGVGCRMDDEKAVERLFKIRNRPKSQATPVLVSSIEMAKKYLKPIPDDVKKLMQKYWPGALTIILPCKTALVPGLVRGGGGTLGVRMPNHETPYSKKAKTTGLPVDEAASIAARSAYKAEKRTTASTVGIYTIIYSLGVPILGPSANFHGAKTPYKFSDLDPEFVKLVDYVLSGECSVGLASTVIDCSVKPWKIVRQGKIKIDLKIK